MENNSLNKQIKDKGNGQALIYINKRWMKENNLEFGDLVSINKK